MIIVNIVGGLGNQMFQYACGQAIAAATTQEVRYTTDIFAQQNTHNGYELDRVFGLTVPMATTSELREMIGKLRAHPTCRRAMMKYQVPQSLLGKHFRIERGTTFDINLAKSLDAGGYIHGYWQSERYFAPIIDQIRAAFTFKGVKNVALSNKERINVSVHVRRGDYLLAGSIHASCNADYYFRALASLDLETCDTRVHVFSDDPVWAREALHKLHPNTNFIEGNIGADSYKDMYLMSQCDHHIIANSSYSWWGAWLNPSSQKRVIAPKRWFTDPSMDDSDFLPQSWERM
ncbi:hypothetical protein B9057_15060 (plasmid) [Aestuarium zhoushanense]|nr:hypothetical protein B9057_15060 [Aestuarium zhoushanense]